VRSQWVSKGVVWVEAFDQIPLVAQTLVELFGEKEGPHHLARCRLRGFSAPSRKFTRPPGRRWSVALSSATIGPPEIRAAREATADGAKPNSQR
jgi:hypothetical protein